MDLKQISTAIVSCLFISFITNSQKLNIPCDNLLMQEPYMFRSISTPISMVDSITHDYVILHDCGGLDSIDINIFQGPLLGSLMVAEASKDHLQNGFTYQFLLDLITDFKKQHPKEYQQMRAGTIARLEIQNLPVILSEFDKIKPKLLLSGMNESEVTAFERFLNEKNKNWTYQEAVQDFYKSKKQTQTTKQPLSFPALDSYDAMLKEGKNAGKNCLIFFTGWGCVNSRKFEQQVLTNTEIQQTIQDHFIYKVAYVDERTKTNNGSGTVGDAHIKLQIDKFKSSAQPVLYIVTPEGKILASWDYTTGYDQFPEFLEKGL